MTKIIPDYLRLHRGIHSAAKNVIPPHDSLRCFWDAYSDVTGWRIDQRAATNSESMELLPAVNSETAELSATTAVSKIAAARLAESATRLAEELARNREAMRRQEMELASRAPILSADTDRLRIANRIEQLLADAATACHCDAAAMYLLDEETQYLKARAVHGLPIQRLEQQARPLRGSRADLQAMVEDVVLIEDLNASTFESWNSPEPFASGICGAIYSDGIPIGTLWLFSHEKRPFSSAQAVTAKFAANQLGWELAQACHGIQKDRKQLREPVLDLAQWQYEALPVGSMVAEGWRVDGLIESPNDWATGWHAWDVLPDGSVMIAIAEAVDPSVKGAMSAAIARAALAAHTGYRHTVSQILQRVSDTLWQTSTAEQLVSILYAQIDPESGDGEVASAGSINAMIASRYGFRPLMDNRSDPLNTRLDARTSTKSFRLLEGEALMAYSMGFGSSGPIQMLLGNTLRGAMQAGEANPLAQVRRAMADTPLDRERGAVTLIRE